MKKKLHQLCIMILTLLISACNQKDKKDTIKILFLHHSTGGIIWYGKDLSLLTRAGNKITKRLTNFGTKAELPMLIEKYNRESGSSYSIIEQAFPKETPYGWSNDPYDYYNIWVKNAGDKPYMEEPTLEMLTKKFNLIIFKHCFPVSNIQPDQETVEIDSKIRTLSNYKLQYQALKEKLHQFPDTKFMLFTGAAQVKGSISPEEATRAKEFFSWVVAEWDQPDDNIFIWDLYSLETEGGLYFVEKYAESNTDAHPNGEFAEIAVKLLFNRIIDVIENGGRNTTVTGIKL